MTGMAIRSATIAVAAAQAGLALYVAKFGPTTPIPMHFDIHGQVNRWGDRGEAALVIGLMAGLSAVAGFGAEQLSLGRRTPPTSPRTLAQTQMLVLAVTTAVCGLIASLAFGLAPRGGGLFGQLVVSGLLAGIGTYLGKVGPNPLVGVRTPWTFASRLAWDKANRLAGRLFFWGGLAGLLTAPFAPQPAGLQIIILGVVASAALTVFESWRVWRDDPDRAKWS